MGREPLFKRFDRVIISETKEVVTISKSWYGSIHTEKIVPQYDIMEYPSTWFSESQLEKVPEKIRKINANAGGEYR